MSLATCFSYKVTAVLHLLCKLQATCLRSLSSQCYHKTCWYDLHLTFNLFAISIYPKCLSQERMASPFTTIIFCYYATRSIFFFVLYFKKSDITIMLTVSLLSDLVPSLSSYCFPALNSVLPPNICTVVFHDLKVIFEGNNEVTPPKKLE